ncbi:hypothetical protein [Hydrogenophaga crassostreae]
MQLSPKSLSISLTQPLLAMGLCLGAAQHAFAQDTIFRCGNEYINDAAVAKRRGCKTMEGGNITIIQGTRPSSVETPKSAPKSSSGSARSSGSRIDTADQRARDSDARAILQAELDKAKERLAQASKAYAGGAPEKEGIEGRNHQRYLDRVAELKAAKERAEVDVSSISRELDRLGPASSGSNAAQ